MAKQIVVLDSYSGSGGITVNYLFWYPVPSGQEVPVPGFVSLYRGLTASERIALQQGTVLEEPGSAVYASSMTTAQIESDLIARYNARSTQRSTFPNPNQYYGASWDGTTWSAGAIAPSRPGRLLSVNGSPSTAGDNTVISGVPNRTIAVYGLLLVPTGAVSIALKDGTSSTLLPACPLLSGQPLFLWSESEPLFVCSPGNSFLLNLSLAVAVSGRVWYSHA